MHPENQRDNGHNQQRTESAATAAAFSLMQEHVPQYDHPDKHTQIKPVAAGQQHGFAADSAAEFAEGNDRAGEGDRADQNAQVDFNFMNRFFRSGQRG